MRFYLPIVLVFAVLIGISLPAQSRGSSSQKPGKAAQTGAGETAPHRSAPEQQIFDLLNMEREKAGLSRLQWDDRVAEAAREHAKLLAANGDLSHQFAGEAAPPERLAAAGARFTVSAENVANAGTSEEAHMGLMLSPGHRANIMSTRYNAAGIGVVESNGRLFVTQDFAWITPAYTEAEFREAFIAAFNRARAAKGIAAIEARADVGLHSAACSAKSDEPVLAAPGFNATEIVRFTISEPEKVPEQLMRYAQDQRQRHMDLGVCFRPDARYGYANFWVVAAFGG